MSVAVAAGEECVVEELWAGVEPFVADGVLMVAYDGATGFPLPVGDRLVGGDTSPVSVDRMRSA